MTLSARDARLSARGRTARLARTPRSIPQLAASIVASYVKANPLDSAELPDLIVSIEACLSGREAPVPAAPLVPAVPIADSIQRDYLVCLEDGRKLRSMKRHLRIAYGLSPAEYRTKWGLPGNYPMVPPSYSERRSDLAKHFGLGKLASAPTAEASPVVYFEAAQTIGEDGIINLLNGRVVKDLGREVARAGVTSEAYREQFGLPANYPMKLSRATAYLSTTAG